MSNSNFFDASYVDRSSDTSQPARNLEAREFLKQPIKEEELIKYGSSKPRRVIIKAEVTNG